MLVLRKTMDAAVAAEREKSRADILNVAHHYGAALERVSALQQQIAAWLTNNADGITPEQMADMFYAHDDRWQAAFFNVMQARVTAHHDALPDSLVFGKCPGVPAGEAQWWHMARHLDESGLETLEAMLDHAKSARRPTPAKERVG